MKSKVLIFVLAAAVVVAGASFVIANTNKKDSMNMTSNGSGTTATPVADANTVIIEKYAYQPAVLKIKKGTKVTWINKDVARHTVSSDSGSGPMSQLFGKGESFTYTFDTVGTYKYHCDPHPYMHGAVEVTE